MNVCGAVLQSDICVGIVTRKIPLRSQLLDLRLPALFAACLSIREKSFDE